jgi:demethylmenaquinone methyltransferase / 2-methoxy-6-polyprenyl-1,4-benzoquinol methylase
MSKSKEADKLSRAAGDSRKSGVREMFNGIAHSYDLLNHVLSGGMDILWRKKAVRLLEVKAGGFYLDLASGTGDYAFNITRKEKDCRIVACDLAEEMLVLMREKMLRTQTNDRIELVCGDAEDLPFDSSTFDGLTIGYGIRNFPDKKKALQECGRVINPGGKLVILEIAGIPNPLLRHLFDLYFRIVLPIIGSLVSGNKMAYSYLPASVREFPQRDTFLSWMRESGFSNARCIDLSFGISSIFIGTKE